MANRSGGDGPDDGAGFDWLYGGRPRGGAEDPEATQAIRRQPRPDGAPPPPPPPGETHDRTQAMPMQGDRPRDAGPQGPQPAYVGTHRPTSRPQPPAPVPAPAPEPGREPTRPARQRPRLRPRRFLRLIPALLVLWLVFLIAVPIFAWTKVSKVPFEPSGDRPAEQPGTTYLLVGSDSRADLSAEQRQELTTGNPEGQRTDTIMLLHTGSGPNVLMSIPRDSIVEIPGNGTGKINAAYAYGGPELLVQTIESSTGIRVDEYVEIGLGGFVDVVDAVGGIEICPDQRMRDPQAGLNIKKGCQEANGVTALGYARSRKTYTQYGDVQRAQAQREVVSAIGDKVLSPWTVLNPWRYWSLNMAATGAIAFGEGTGPLRAAQWASAMTNVDGEDGLTCGVPIRDLAVNWDEERSQQMFDAIIEDRTDDIGRDLCTPTGFPRQG